MKRIINVTSNNQKGGTTAGEINKNAQPEYHNFWQKPFNKYVLIPLIVVIIGGIAVYYLTNSNIENNIFNVTSSNQQGGITAGQVNIGTPQRHLNDGLKAQLENFRDKKISITAVMGDAEAIQFGQEIKGYLEQNGFDFVSSAQAVFNGPIKGQSIREEKDGSITLIIGSNVK